MADKSSIDATALAMTLQLRLRLASRPTALQSHDKQFSEADARHLAARFSRTDLLQTAPTDPQWLNFAQQLRNLDKETDRYEDPRLHAMALDLIPFEALHDRADAIQKSNPTLEFQDALIDALVVWAKRDFLHWVDPIKCSICSQKCEPVGADNPTLEERRNGGAGRVELHGCPIGHIHRFPRYSHLDKLLQTRTGRCGEFAAIFMLLLRALSIRARYIWNSEDHVWNEYYSDALKRWVHLDSCEGARDKNLLYDRGWGKKMKYCIAFGIDGARDVTLSYVSNWAETLSRRNSGWEILLTDSLANITRDRRRAFDAEASTRLVEEDAAETHWLADIRTRLECAEKEDLSGRTSGTVEWRQQRHELGKAGQAQPKPMSKGRKLGDQTSVGLTLNGSASFADGEIVQLTKNRPDQVGSAMMALPDDVRSMIITFSFRITGHGADGMACVLHSAAAGVKALGTGGCELGYGGIPHSVAIEIDTYRTQDFCDDPPTPHISVHTVGASPNSAHHKHSLWCSPPGSMPPFNDGQVYSIKLEISAIRSVSVWLTDSISSSREDWVCLTQDPIALPGLENFQYIGWTAATGGLHQSHELISFGIYEADEQDDTVPQ